MKAFANRRWIELMTAATLVLAALMFMLGLSFTDRGNASVKLSSNRCSPVISGSSFSYDCWAAYPEGFSFTGGSTARYRISWRISCNNGSVANIQTVGPFVTVYVGLVSAALSKSTASAQAYRLMEASNGHCRLKLSGARLGNSGSIAAELFINQNHPLPVHT